MGLFSGIEDASVGRGGVYFLDGTYRVEVVKCSTIRNRKKDDLFMAECKILESDCEARKPGMLSSWYVNLKHDAALGNIKGFIAAANGIDPEDDETVNREVTEDAVEYSVGSDNPLEGYILDLVAITVPTRAGGEYTKHHWSPVAEAD